MTALRVASLAVTFAGLAWLAYGRLWLRRNQRRRRHARPLRGPWPYRLTPQPRRLPPCWAPAPDDVTTHHIRGNPS